MAGGCHRQAFGSVLAMERKRLIRLGVLGLLLVAAAATFVHSLLRQDVDLDAENRVQTRLRRGELLATGTYDEDWAHEARRSHGITDPVPLTNSIN